MSEIITIPVEKAGSYVVTLPVASIKIGNRYRKDMGDLFSLAQSIKELGLLQPIAVDKEHRLIYGERRLMAHIALERETILARIIEVDALLAEQAENEVRKAFTPSERVAIAAAIEEVIGNRKGQRTDKATAQLPQNFGEVNGKETAQIAAKAAGFGNAETYRQAKAVVKEGATELVQAVDKGEIAISTAAKLVKASPETQREAVAKPQEAPRLAKAIERPIRPMVDLTANAITLDAWNALTPVEGLDLLCQPTSKKMNAQDTGSIGWAAWSWNPITGCEHDCQYCYARDIANRFYGELGFKPALYPDRLQAPGNVKPAGDNNRVFTCSMADLFGKWVPAVWIHAVLNTIRANPDFQFLLLTKNPQRLVDFEFPDNAWVGTTCDTQRRMDVAQRLFPRIKARIKWVSVEPMLEPIRIKKTVFDWVVIGGATKSSGQPAFVPPFEWIANLAYDAYQIGARVYLKDNARNSWPEEFPSKEAANHD